MKTYLKFLSTISLLDFLKYSLLNTIFFIASSKVFIDTIMYYIVNYQSDILIGDFITSVALFYILFIPTTIIFFLFYKNETKQKLPLFILNILFLRSSTINEHSIDFLKNTDVFGLVFFVSCLISVGIIYLIRFQMKPKRQEF